MCIGVVMDFEVGSFDEGVMASGLALSGHHLLLVLLRLTCLFVGVGLQLCFKSNSYFILYFHSLIFRNLCSFGKWKAGLFELGFLGGECCIRCLICGLG